MKTNGPISEIKKKLSGIGGLRLAPGSAMSPANADRIRNRDSQVAVSKLLSSVLKIDGSTKQKFGELLAQDGEKLAAKQKKLKGAAIKRGRANAKALTLLLKQRADLLAQQLTLPVTLGSPKRELVNVPFLIWPTSKVDLVDSSIVPSNSWAKFRLTADTNRTDEVKFYYLWENPNNAFAVIDVHGYLVLNGYIQAAAGGGLFPGDRYSKISVDARLDIYEWWNQPPTSPFPQPDQTQNAGVQEINQEGWSEVGGILPQTIFRGYDLSYSQMIVPPQARVVFAVTASITSSNGIDSGQTEADFASGGFHVASPAVLVAILS